MTVSFGPMTTVVFVNSARVGVARLDPGRRTWVFVADDPDGQYRDVHGCEHDDRATLGGAVALAAKTRWEESPTTEEPR